MPLIPQAYNLSAGNRWILSIPIKAIDPELSVDNFIFNLTSVDIPDREIVSADFPIRGRPIPVPTGVRADAQIVTARYMLSSDWHQYSLLNKWYEMYANDNHGVEGQTLDIALYLLTEFKQPIFYINFKNCWLHNLGGFTMNYQDGFNQLEGSFSFKYALMDLDNLPEL